MRIKLRQGPERSAILFIPETKEESRMIDVALGDKLQDGDGLIAHVEGEVRLSDGYADHYVILRAKKEAKTDDSEDSGGRDEEAT